MSYNLLQPFHFVAAHSLAATFTSTPVEIKLQDNVGVELIWTGTPVGTFNIQVSMNYQVDMFGNVTNVGNWVTLTLNPGITASGAGDVAYIELNQLSAPYIRLQYVRTGGAGTVDGYVTAKGV